MLDSFQNADQAITLFINSFHSQISDNIMQMFSNKYVWIPVYLFVVYMMFRRLGWKKGLAVVLSVVLAIVICDQFSGLVKNYVDRLRPNYNSEMIRGQLHLLEVRTGYFGFFSGHATNAFCFAVCTIIGFRNDEKHTYNAYRTWVLIWAAFVSLSRVFVGKHYFGDILVGAGVGVLIGYCAGALCRHLIAKYVTEA